MSPQRCAARVLRSYPLGETSLIVLLLTKEQGLIRAVAKGARTEKSRYRALLEPGWPLEILVYLKPRGLHLLGDVSLRGRLPLPSRRLETLALRLAALELVMQSSEEGEPQPELFELLEDYLEVFDLGGEEGPLPFFAFEAGLLRLHGVGPDPEACALCGRTLGAGDLRFLPGEGLFTCRAHESEGIDLARDEGDWLKSIFLANPSALKGRLLPDAARHRIGRVLHLALGRHLPGYRLPRSLAMLRSSRSGGAPSDEEPSA